MNTRTLDTTGRCAPSSAVLLMLAISATLIFAAGCGDVEDIPNADTGNDVISSDTFGGDVGYQDSGSDATPDAASPDTISLDDTDSTEELPVGFEDDVCDICFDRGYDECPTFDRILSWVRTKLVGNTPEDAADAMCPVREPVEDACTPFEYVLETDWECDGMPVTFEALEERELPESDEVACYGMIPDNPPIPLREDDSGQLVLFDEYGGHDVAYCAPAE